MARLVNRILENEERSKTVLATIAAVGGVAAIMVCIFAPVLK